MIPRTPAGTSAQRIEHAGGQQGEQQHAEQDAVDAERIQAAPLQERQLTCWGGNVRSFAVQGSFDDCQRMVKQAFADPELRTRLRLNSANSINIGRLLPQLCYFGAAALSVPMWLMLSRRYTKTVAWFIAMVMTVAAMSLAVFTWSPRNAPIFDSPVSSVRPPSETRTGP